MDHLLTTEWSRRSLLRAAVGGAMLACSRVLSPATAQARQFPEGRLLLYNAHTSERMDIAYRDGQGRYDRGALVDLNHFMRCHHSNTVAVMDLRVIEILNTIRAQVGESKELVIHSAYRSPEYHTYLIRHNRRAARHSFHVTAQAVDFHVEGVPLRTLKQAALRLGHGGVGYYPRRGFLHVDCGPARYW